MSQKTNKLASKRLKVTKTGKVMHRTVRKNALNSKSSGETKKRKKRGTKQIPKAEARTILQSLLPRE